MRLEITMPCTLLPPYRMCSWPSEEAQWLDDAFDSQQRRGRSAPAQRRGRFVGRPWAIPKRPSPRSPTDANACEKWANLEKRRQLNTQPSSREGENPKDKYQILIPTRYARAPGYRFKLIKRCDPRHRPTQNQRMNVVSTFERIDDFHVPM